MVVLKSTVHEQVALDMAPVIVNEITLLGSRCGRFQAALTLLGDATFDLSCLLCAEFPLLNAAQAFERAAERGTLKVLLRNEL